MKFYEAAPGEVETHAHTHNSTHEYKFDMGRVPVYSLLAVSVAHTRRKYKKQVSVPYPEE